MNCLQWYAKDISSKARFQKLSLGNPLLEQLMKVVLHPNWRIIKWRSSSSGVVGSWARSRAHVQETKDARHQRGRVYRGNLTWLAALEMDRWSRNHGWWKEEWKGSERVWKVELAMEKANEKTSRCSSPGKISLNKIKRAPSNIFWCFSKQEVHECVT